MAPTITTMMWSAMKRFFAGSDEGPGNGEGKIAEGKAGEARVLQAVRRNRRKCVPGAFAQHKGHVADRACRREGRELRGLVAIRTRSGLKFARREHYLRLLAKARKFPQQAKG